MPAKPIRLLHLSDFQVGKEPYDKRALFEPIIEAVRERAAAGAAPDLVLLSGDIAFSAQPAQYHEFTEHFLLPLSEVLGDTVWERTFVVPGNHDVDWSKSKSIDLRTVLDRVPYLLDPDSSGYAERTNLLQRFRAFADADLPKQNQWLFSERGYDTQILSLHGYNVGILRLNTAWLSGDNNDRHHISPGFNIAEAGLSDLKDCDIRIVIGHHPIEWFIDEEALEFYELFRRNQAIYVHGHVYTPILGKAEGSARTFLSLCTGAAFKPRGKEHRIASISWYDLDLTDQQLFAETLCWDHTQRAWFSDTEMFHKSYYNTDIERWQFSLRHEAEETHRTYSDGWDVVNTTFLARYQSDPSDERTIEQVLHYFDGGQPDWRIILARTSESEGNSPLYLPQRAIADDLKQSLEDSRERGTVDITLLTGAIGEGKSTVLRQVVCDLARDSERWTVIWHSNPEQLLDRRLFTKELFKPRVYLLVSDAEDPDRIVKNVFRMAAWLRASNHRNFHFLLCCRDTDWIAARGNELRQEAQNKEVPFTPKTLKGLTVSDATKIVGAWQRLGQPGLRELYAEQFNIKSAAERFVNEARTESYSTPGAFLGALLRVRFGDNLKEHVEQLLWKLHSRAAPPKPDGNLMDAFAYIAAMHAENLLFLSKEVLAKALSCTIKDLQAQVINPLGSEAFVSAGRHLLTRHRLIAKAAVDILSNELLAELGKNAFEDLYADLAIAAEELFLNGELPDKQQRDNFRKIPEKLLKNGNVTAGIHVGRALLRRWPAELRFLVELSKLYRSNKTYEQAARLFRDPERQLYRYDRACYNEWATAEGLRSNFFLDVWLSGVALADGIELNLEDDMAVMALNGLTITFHNIFKASLAPEQFALEACSAAGNLARQLDRRNISLPGALAQVRRCLETCESHGITQTDPATAVQFLEAGIQMAWNHCKDDLPEWSWLPTHSPLLFTRLRSKVSAR